MCREIEYATEAHHFAGMALPDYIPAKWRDRITVYIDAKGVHYLWTGWNNGEGHGKVSIAGKMRYTHREIVERIEGRKLDRFQYVDHKCEMKACLNYDHLEVTTPGENTYRGPGRHTQFRPVACPCQQSRDALDVMENLHASWCGASNGS